MTSTVIFRSENLLVRFVGGFARSHLVITFDCHNSTRSLERSGFGEVFLSERSIDAIHVMSKDNDWYQYPEMDQALDAIAAHTRPYSRVVSYGASMGAYAAIRFASRVEAQAAIAISPQYSIDPAVCPFEDRWGESKSISFRYDAGAKIDQISNAVVFYDPYDVNDNRQVSRIKEDIHITEVRLPHAGHSAGIYLSELSLLTESVLSIIYDTFSARETTVSARMRRRETSKYHATLAKRASRKGHLNWALSLAKTASEKNPSHARYISTAARIIAKTGDIGDAAFWQRQAVALEPDQLEHSIDLTALLLRTDAYLEALDICNRIIERDPGRGMAYYLRAKALMIKGDYKDALLSAHAAKNLEPDHLWFRECVTECELAFSNSALSYYRPTPRYIPQFSNDQFL